MIGQFTPAPKYPTYPPYHSGPYLEDYFHQYAIGKQFGRQYIPVSWTTWYCDGHPTAPLQAYLDSLPKHGKYFTVCQHDDAPRERLPPDTLVFSAGGNSTNGTIVAIPLVCSPIPSPCKPDTQPILASFVGSQTHPIRQELFSRYRADPDFHFQVSGWNPRVSSEKLSTFTAMTQQSKFCLCPRGYGASSFRLYEAMQLGSVPVYISDKHYCPWRDELDWTEFCVRIRPDQMPSLKQILLRYTDELREQMVTRARELWEDYFSLPGVAAQIHKRVGATT